MNAHSGKTALVTGASSGIGRASAAALAQAGFTVFGTSRRTPGNGPNQVSMLTCDVTSDGAVDALVSTVLTELVGEAVVVAATAARPWRRYPTGTIERQVSVLRGSRPRRCSTRAGGSSCACPPE